MVHGGGLPHTRSDFGDEAGALQNVESADADTETDAAEVVPEEDPLDLTRAQ